MQKVNSLEITNAKIKKLLNLGRLVAEATITINGCIVIHGIRIIQLDSDRRIASFPQKELPDGKKVDIIHPITTECRRYIEDYLFELLDKMEENIER